MERRYTQPTDVRIEKREDGTATIVGYGAVFYREGDDSTEYELWPGLVERVDPSAFNRALKESDDARGLFNHDSSLILGRVSSGTMRLSTDKRGLRYEIDTPDTQAARDVVTSIGRGDVSGSSFAFRVLEQEWTEEKHGATHIEVRTLLDVELFDTGPVTYPAYQGTTTGVRSSQDADEAHQAYKAWKAERARLAENVANQARLDEATAILAGLP